MHLPANAFVLPFPVHLTPWAVARFHGDRDRLRGLWGQPHFVEDDPHRTAGGDEDNWAWELPGGQRVLFVLAVPYKEVLIYCDPPLLAAVVDAFGIEPVIQGLEAFPKPIIDPGYCGLVGDV
jgi:hypothetical protein